MLAKEMSSQCVEILSEKVFSQSIHAQSIYSLPLTIVQFGKTKFGLLQKYFIQFSTSQLTAALSFDHLRDLSMVYALKIICIDARVIFYKKEQIIPKNHLLDLEMFHYKQFHPYVILRLVGDNVIDHQVFAKPQDSNRPYSLAY